MTRPTPPTPLAIVGMACLFPKADGLGAYWANIKRGVDGISEVPASHWRPEEYFDADPKRPDFTYAHRGGFLSPVDFDPAEFGISPNTLEATDASQLLGLVVAKRALADAGYGPERAFERERASVILGVTGTLQLVIPLGARLGHPIWRKALAEAGIEGEVADDVVARIADGYVGWQENSFPGLLGNVVAGRIANRLDLGGTNCVVDAACASSLSAVHMATMELASGRSDMVVTGGVDCFNDIFMYMCFSKTPALSPSGDSRPFDAEGDGTILGEGLGMVVLKRLEDAERDGDTVYAVIKSVGSSSDGRGKAIYAPSADGQKRALESAYRLAGVTPDTIEMVEAHGTGTKVGDATELAALREVYGAMGKAGSWVSLGSVKSQIGHTKASAGVAGLIKAALAVHHKVLPPTIKIRQPLPGLGDETSPFYVTDASRPWMARRDHPRRAAVSAFGFGGSNFHAVVEEHGADKPGADWDGRVLVAAFSAESESGIEAALSALKPGMAWDELRVAAYRANAAFTPARHRLVLVIERDVTDLAALLSNVRAQLKEGREAWSTPDGAFYGSGEAAGGLGVLFPGQGAQYVGMGRELAVRFPEVFTAIARADAAFGDLPQGDRLSDRLLPPTAFTAEARSAQDARLRDTRAAQPAIGAVSLGAYRLLETFGLRPDAAAGHSYGELTALCAAGRLTEEEFYALSCLRGRLMAEGEGDRGTMLAVQAPTSRVRELVTAHGLEVVLANQNAQSQVVLSGATAAIERARAVLSEAGLRTVPLPVAAAFHSPLVAEAQGPLREALKGATFGPAAMAVYANTTAGCYPEEAEAARDLLAGQLAAPVEFVAQIEAMYAAGVRTFFEVGPGARLTGLVRQILEGKEHQAIALDATNGKRDGVVDLARALAALAASGRAIDLSGWEGGESGVATILNRKKPALAVPISGANYRAPQKPRPPRPRPVAEVKRASNGHAAAPAAKAALPAELNGKAYVNGHVPHTNGTSAMSNGNNGHNGNYTHNGSNGHHAPAPQAAPMLHEALRASQESLLALQKMQEQTAQLHRQFLEGQTQTQEAFKRLLDHQQQVFAQSLGVAPAMPAPPPVVQAPVRPSAGAPSPRRAEARHPSPPPGRGDTKAAEVVRVVSSAVNGVKDTLLAVVAEKTGYPVEMLNLDMELEGDLGIDSIKRVEILSALQEKLPGAPLVKPEHLGTLRTLGQIAEFLGQGASVLSPQEGTAPQARGGEALADHKATAGHTPSSGTGGSGLPRGETTQGGDVAGAIIAVVAEKTGYPAEMLNLDMELESDLGIDSIKRVEILSALQEQLPGAPEVKPEHLGTLRTLGQIAGFLGQGPATAPAAPAVDSGRIERVLLDVVAEKTGYPAEMLNPEMELESDLGIDSIKRVEILSALQEQLPEAPEVKPEHLGTLRTLRQIAEFLGQGASGLSPQGGTAPQARGGEALAGNQVVAGHTPSSGTGGSGLPRGETTQGEDVAAVVIAVVAEKTGYPAEMLNLDMELESDLGIDSIKRVEILSALQERLPGAPAVGPELVGTLRTLRQVVEFLSGPPSPPGGGQSAPPPAAAPAAQGPLSRQVLGVRALDGSRPALALKPSWAVWVADEGTALGAALVEHLNRRGFQARRVGLGDRPAGAAPGALVVLAPEPSADGLWSEADERFLKDAFALVQYAGPALREAGRQAAAALLTVSRLDGRFGLASAAEIAPVQGGLAGLAKTAGHEWPEVACKAVDVDARWDVAQAAEAIARELLVAGPAEVGLAEAGAVTLSLVETPLETEGPAPLAAGDVVLVSGGARGVTAEAAVAIARRYRPTLVLLGRTPEPGPEPEWLAGLTDEPAIKQALLAHEPGVSPRDLQDRYAQVLANREVRRNLARIAEAGARVLYRAVDVRDESAVAVLLSELRAEAGPIRGLVHGAGVLADRLIADKTPEQVDRVIDTKVAGLRALLGAMGQDELRVLALFSSVTGRQGRTGQVDYAMANEALNKIAQREAARRPGCRVVSVNWGPWDGGMVTPALKRLFAAEGVGVVPLAEGAEYLASELAQSGGPVEVLVMGRTEAIEAKVPELPRFEKGPRLHTAFTRELDVRRYPFLASHVINGNPVLPVAVIAEWMAHAALTSNPGLSFAGLEDFRVFKGVILGSAPYAVRLAASSATRRDDGHEVTVELRGGDEADTLHARARVILTERLPAAPQAPVRPVVAPYGRTVGAAYREVLFHGAHFQGIRQLDGLSEEGFVARVATAPAPSSWLAQPLRDTWLTDPLALDAAFQLMILWSAEHAGAPCLPCHAKRFRQFRASFPSEGVTAIGRVTEHRAGSAVADIAFVDAEGAVVALLEGAESTVDAGLAEAFRRNQVAAGTP